MPRMIAPLAPKTMPTMPAIAGMRLASFASNSRYRGRDDLWLAHFDRPAAVGGVFTRSQTAAAPIDWCRAVLKTTRGRARGLIVNAGIANAFTGKRGATAVARICRDAGAVLDCDPEQILAASTGVIGEDLDPAPLRAALRGSAARLDAPPDFAAAAAAMMTTDTFAKYGTRRVRLGGQVVNINLIAKGSGMIAPDMATMLAFAFTDAALPPRIMQALVEEANQRSFSAITVDGDTSTSDTFLAFATGALKPQGGAITAASDPRLAEFRKAFCALAEEVAIQIASDGEGAQKLMHITVRGAQNDASARQVGLAIGNSPLVKTAIAGGDANWGRIVMAIGKSGAAVARDRIGIAIGGVQIARRGRAIAGYDETPVARHMRGQHIDIDVNLGIGRGRARIWACDLTHGYIDINADYRS